MNLPEGARLAYSIRHEAWTWETARHGYGDRPGIGVAALGDDTACWWEFSVEERDLLGMPAIEVRIYDDAWAAFVAIPEFFAALAGLRAGEGRCPTLADVRALLDRLGAVDETQRTDPPATKETSTS